MSDPRARAGQILVVDGFGLPYANTAVLVDSTVVTTDADGYATLPKVGASYDVSVVAPPMAFTFVGLTTRAPVVDVMATTNGNGASAISVDVQLSQALGTNQKLVYSAGFADYAASSITVPPGDTHGVSFRAYWPGSSATEFTTEAFSIEIDPVSGAAHAFSQYALETWTVTPGDAITWTPDFEPVPFETKTIHVDVALPPACEINDYSAYAIERSGRLGLFSSADASSSGDVLALDLPDTTYSVGARAVSQDRTSEFLARTAGVHAGDTVTIDLNDVPRQLAPADGAVVTPDTVFGWNPAHEAVDQLYVSATSSNGTFTYVITTSESSARLPDLGALGTSFPAPGTLIWQLVSVDGRASVDTVAAGAPWQDWTYTGSRRATTAPQ